MTDIEIAQKNKMIPVTEVAAKIGISEYTFCRWFRKELTAEQQERILAAIADIKAGEAHA